MHYAHILATAKEGGRPLAPSLLISGSHERVVKDRVIVQPVKNQYDEIFKASKRLAAGESIFPSAVEKEITPAA